MTPLDDKTALITGGIGRAIAFQLAQRGVDVAVAARSQDELVETTSAMSGAQVERETAVRISEAGCVRPRR